MIVAKKFFFLFGLLFFPLISVAVECRNSPGGYCTYSSSDCVENGGHVDTSYDCLGESAGDYCCLPGAAETPTPTPSTGCQYVCVPQESCSVQASGYCGTGVCCQTQTAAETDCAKKGGACFPSSTACYGGAENELGYECNSGQHCCGQTVNTCEDNGGTCVASGTSCEKVLQYSCGENGGTCCDTGSSSQTGDGSWEQGLTQAGQTAKLPDADFKKVLNGILKYTLALLTLFGVIFFILTGLRYIFGGATGEVEKSKLGIQSLIMGLVVGLSGYIIIKLVNYLLGG